MASNAAYLERVERGRRRSQLLNELSSLRTDVNRLRVQLEEVRQLLYAHHAAVLRRLK